VTLANPGPAGLRPVSLARRIKLLSNSYPIQTEQLNAEITQKTPPDLQAHHFTTEKLKAEG